MNTNINIIVTKGKWQYNTNIHSLFHCSISNKCICRFFLHPSMCRDVCMDVTRMH